MNIDFILQLTFVCDNSVLSVNLAFESSSETGPCLTTVDLSNKTICIELEYKLLQILLTKIDSYVTLISIIPAGARHSGQVCVSSKLFMSSSRHRHVDL